MKTNKKFKRLHLEKNKTRSKFSGGTSRFNTTKKFFDSISTGVGNIGKGIGKRVGYIKNSTNNPLHTPNRFRQTSKVFRGIGRKFGLYQKTSKEKMKKAVDELVEEIKKFNDKTKTYSQYGINDNDAEQLKQEINRARESFKLGESKLSASAKTNP